MLLLLPLVSGAVSCGHERSMLQVCLIKYSPKWGFFRWFPALPTCGRSFWLEKSRVYCKMNVLFWKLVLTAQKSAVCVGSGTDVSRTLKPLAKRCLMSLERNLNQRNVCYMSGSAKCILRIFSAFFATNKLSTCKGLKHENADVIVLLKYHCSCCTSNYLCKA